MNDKIKLRFAPSPTGMLHIGNIRIAILNWLFAKKNNAHFLLRIDDTDKTRSKKEFIDLIKKDLSWLGISWDSYALQSDNIHIYQEKFEHLKKMGRIYPCFETEQELELKRTVAINSGKPPIYDRSSLNLTPDEIKKLINNGKKPHWRFLLNEENIVWNDLCRGKIQFNPKNLSDPVLIRADGTFLYTISSVIDDINFKISHIIRGEDHITNTAVQIQLFKALAAEKIPAFAHSPLINNIDGKMSKRIGSSSIKEYRKNGIEPFSIISYLTHLGTSFSANGNEKINDIVNNFSLNSFGKSSPKFKFLDIEKINSNLVKTISYEDIKERISPKINKALWDIIKNNISKINEANSWADLIFTNKAVYNITNNKDAFFGDENFFDIAIKELKNEKDINTTTWKTWTEKIKKLTDKSGKSLFMPLRVALTGKTNGPEMGKILPFIGLTNSLKRLDNYKKQLKNKIYENI